MGVEEHWSLTSVMPGPARLSAGTSQRFRANLRVAAGPDLAESAPGPEGRWRPMGVGGRHPHSGSGGGGAPRLARARPPFPSAPVGGGGVGVGNPGSGTTPGGRPGRGVASRKRAEERSSRVSPSPRPRALGGPAPAPHGPCAPTPPPRAEGAGGRRLGAPCTCREVQVAARALRPGPGPALRRAPGGAGEAGRPVPAPFNFAAAARRAGGRRRGRSGARLLTRCRRGRPAAASQRATPGLQVPDACAAPGGYPESGAGPREALPPE